MTSRSRGRQFAVQMLYQKAFSEYETDRVFSLFWKGVKADRGTRAFSEDLVRGVLANAPQLDMEITGYLKNWSLERIVTIDHLVLQLGFFELLHRGEVPWKVAVDEAVGLAQMFSSEKSANFINGILHAWAVRNRDPEEDSGHETPSPDA